MKLRFNILMAVATAMTALYSSAQGALLTSDLRFIEALAYDVDGEDKFLFASDFGGPFNEVVTAHGLDADGQPVGLSQASQWSAFSDFRESDGYFSGGVAYGTVSVDPASDGLAVSHFGPAFSVSVPTPYEISGDLDHASIELWRQFGPTLFLETNPGPFTTSGVLAPGDYVLQVSAFVTGSDFGPPISGGFSLEFELPAPGAMGLFMCAGLLGGGRRRREVGCSADRRSSRTG